MLSSTGGGTKRALSGASTADPILRFSEFSGIGIMGCSSLVHQLLVQLSHKTESHREIVLLNTLHSVVKCFDVMQNIIDIFRNICTD